MRIILTALTIWFIVPVTAQSVLKPGFDPGEYGSLLSLAYFSSSIPDSVERLRSEDPYKRVYRSPELGFNNLWTLYHRQDNIGVISLRGTVNNGPSWIANFYAAMIPATGTLHLSDSSRFTYRFAENPEAMVHAGWAIGIAHLGPDIKAKILEDYHGRGIREYLIFGHSQGGALAFLLRSWLEYEKGNNGLPADLLFKTYCSAAPKPGNMYFAYDFDFITRNGWAYTVVNAADWVPETPFTVQTLKDFNPTNPFSHTKKILRRQKFIVRVAGNVIYDKLERKPRKAQRKFEKYLGRLLFKKGVKKILPTMEEPVYAAGNNYMRAGIPIVLMADKAYTEKYPDGNEKFFIHHGFAPYYYLLKKWYPD